MKTAEEVFAKNSRFMNKDEIGRVAAHANYMTNVSYTMMLMTALTKNVVDSFKTPVTSVFHTCKKTPIEVSMGGPLWLNMKMD